MMISRNRIRIGSREESDPKVGILGAIIGAFLSLASIVSAQGGVINVAEHPLFPVVPNDNQDDTANLEQLVSLVDELEDAELYFPPGVYDFGNSISNEKLRQNLYFLGIEGIRFLGSTSSETRFRFHGRYQYGISLLASVDITFENIVLEYAKKPMTQGYLTGIDPQGLYVDVTIMSPYLEPSTLSDPFLLETINRFQVHDPVQRKIRTGTGEIYLQDPEAQSPTPLGQGVYRFHLAWPQSYALNATQLQDIVVLKTSEHGSFFNAVSQNTVLRNIVFRNSPSAGYYESNCYNTIIDSCTIAPADGDFISTNRDGINVSNSRLGPVIYNTTIKATGDDCICLRSGWFIVDSVSNNGTTVHMYGSNDPLIQPGDQVEFFNQSDLSSKGVGTVSSVGWGGFVDPPEAFEYTLTFASPVNAAIGDSAIDVSGTCSGFILAGNNIGGNYARGMLIQASNGYIIGNRIEGSSLGGIIMSPEAEILEAGWVRNVEVAWNEISGVGINRPTACQAGAIVVSFSPGGNAFISTPKIWDTSCQNFNISIHDNTIKNVGSCGVLLTNVDGASVYGNKIWSNHWNPETWNSTAHVPENSGLGMKRPYGAIQLERCDNVTITNNEIDAAPTTYPENRAIFVPEYDDPNELSRNCTNVTATNNRRVFHTSFEHGRGSANDWESVETEPSYYYKTTSAWSHQDQELLFSFQNWGLYGMDLTAPYFLDRQTSVAQLNQASMEITVDEPDDIQFYFGSSQRNGNVSMSVEARDNLNNLISTSTFVNNAATLDGSSSAPFWTPKFISLPSGATGNWKFTFTRSSSNSAELFVDDIVIGSGNYDPISIP